MTKTETFTNQLKSAGYRLTPQRIAICRELASTPAHPTAQMLHDTLRPAYPSLSLTTVYNTLETLVELGLLHELGNDDDGATRYEPNLSAHVNLKCLNCNSITDMDSPYASALQDDVAAQNDFTLLGGGVLCFGICSKCKDN